MSNWIANTAPSSGTLQFPSVTLNTVQIVVCQNGDRGGFQIIEVTVNGLTEYLSQIFDYSTGTPIAKGFVASQANQDLLGGLFSSGCFANADPLAEGTVFRQLDY